MRAPSPLPTLRSRLLWLAFAGMVPLLVLSLLLAWLLLQREEALVRDGAMDRSRAVASAVDARLEGHLSALRALAASDALAAGRLADFLAEARRVQASHGHWRNVLLVDAQGQQRLNLRLQRLEDLPHERAAEQAPQQQVLATGEPYIGNLGQGPASTIVALPLEIRVSVGEVPMVLKLILAPQALASLLEVQRLPSSWAAAVIDGNGRFVARVPPRAPGDLAAEGLRQAAAAYPQGWVRTRTLEGVDAHQAFVHASLAPWTVAVAIPRSEVLAGTRHAAAWLLSGTLVSLLIGGALALWVSRRVAAPMRALAEAAGTLEAPDSEALNVVRAQPLYAEAQAVVAALERSAGALRERQALQERERAALHEADRVKDEFLAMLGHELRNPLSAIMASAQVLRLATPGARHSERAHDVIDRQTRQMTRLIEDLLDIGRLVAGKLRLERVRSDLWPLVQQTVQGWQQAHEHGRLPVHLLLEGERPWAEVDRARFEQILVNLLDNAYKFSPAGAEITVMLSSEPAWAVLTVRDHGRGIQAADLPQVFDTFYQAPQSMHRPEGGLGLGLSLVRRLCEHQGGEVTAASDGPGQGATFTVKLPRVLPERNSPTVMPAAPAVPQRVLLVDDNDDGRDMLVLLLQTLGHEVRGAGNAAEALQLLARGDTDVALIDIGLPDMDGWALARRVRDLALQPAPRLIALSGFGQPEDEARSHAAGFEQHLTKPVLPETLRGVLARQSGPPEVAAVRRRSILPT